LLAARIVKVTRQACDSLLGFGPGLAPTGDREALLSLIDA
jgi:hypothetical protein